MLFSSASSASCSMDTAFFPGTAVFPRTHEVQFYLTSPFIEVLNGSVVPDFIDHRLPVLFLYNFRHEGTDQVAKLLISKPRKFRSLRHVVKLLERKSADLKFVTQERKHRVREPPQRKVPGILRRTAGYLPVAAFLIWNFKILPCAPCHTIPYQFQKCIIVYHTVIFIRPQHS